jgi:alkylhydroperoxidase family enzyme
MIPRLPLEELPEPLASLLRPRVARLGYLGEFFQAMGHQPEALAHFVAFTEALKGALPPNLTELVALTVSTRVDNRYERVQHERLALRLDLAESWVRAVERLEPTAPSCLDARERAAQALVLAMVDRTGREAAAELAAAEAELGDPRLVAGLMLSVARYLGHAAIANTLGLAPPVSSPLASHG